MGTVRLRFVVFVGALLASGGILGFAAMAQDSQPKSEPQPKGESQPKAASKAAPKNGASQGSTVAPAPAPAAPKAEERASPAPGCGWIGKRVIQSLLRDDAVTAQDFDRLYRTFNCSGEHLRLAFDCTVASGAPQTASEAQARVDSCWNDPKSDPRSQKSQLQTVSPPGSTSGGSPGTSTPQPKGAETSATGASTPNYSPAKGKN